MSTEQQWPIARDLCLHFMREQQLQMQCKILLVSLAGPHACGYGCTGAPVQLKGLHVESTDRLVGLNKPARAHNWVGEYQGHLIDYSSMELGPALAQLLRGDGAVLERVLAPLQLLRSFDVGRLQRVAEGALSRRFHNHYRSFFKRVLRDSDDEHLSVSHLLGVYRLGLTGVELLAHGRLRFDLLGMAKEHGLSGLGELIDDACDNPTLELDDKNPWINKAIRLHTLLDDAHEDSPLPTDPKDPNAVEEYLMDMRRRFFDAATMAQG